MHIKVIIYNNKHSQKKKKKAGTDFRYILFTYNMQKLNQRCRSSQNESAAGQ